MIALGVRFLTGRYHATPWGRHVNEGVPEWPPSPWRLLRALVASWKQTAPNVVTEDVQKLLNALAEPPSFWLPRAAVGHSRHFMPWFKKGPDDRTLVFDTFVALSRNENAYFIWPRLSLDERSMGVLKQLAGGVMYLGRAESWCEVEVEQNPPSPNCPPLVSGEEPSGKYESVRVLTAMPGEPEALLNALFVETGELRSRERRLNPPQSQWILYARPAKVLEEAPARLPKAPIVERSTDPVLAARFALDRRPLPQVQEVLTLGERARQAAMGRYGRMHGGEISPVLSGRDGSKPLKGHRHAFYLSTDEDRDGLIDHLTVYAPAGLGPGERAALGSLQEIAWGKGEIEEGRRLRVLLLGLVRESELEMLPKICGPAHQWESSTPFVLTRYPKTFANRTPKLNELGEQVDGPEDQIRREWEQRRREDPTLPCLSAVRRKRWLELGSGRLVRWLTFRTRRTRGKGVTSGFIYGMSLTFKEPLRGPLALGYGCHFGLGQFVPRDREGARQ